MYIIVIFLFSCFIVCADDSVLGFGGLDKNDVFQKMTNSLPESFTVWSKTSLHMKSKGVFGETDQFYIGIIDKTKKRVRINSQADWIVVFLPRKYIYPDKKTYDLCHSSFLGSSTNFFLYLLESEGSNAIPEICRANICKTFNLASDEPTNSFFFARQTDDNFADDERGATNCPGLK